MSQQNLSRRERQIMDAVYRLGQASAQQVRREMPDPPSYSAVRAMLRILEDKGHLRHREEAGRYVYIATRSRKRAARTALRGVLETFFAGSTEDAVAALLDVADEELKPEQLDRLAGLIEQARKDGQ